MSSVSIKRSYVFSYPEIAGLFIAFVVVLFLLYPENRLEEQVMLESSNYDLTVMYLENMLKHDPKNEALMLALAKTAQKSGNIDLSMKLLGVLHNTKDKALLEEIETVKYYLLKHDLEHLSTTEKAKTIKEVHRLLTNISARPFKTLENIKQWYDEAIWLKDDTLAYQLTSKALQKDTTPYWLKQHYTLALKLNHTEQAHRTLEKLLKFDPRHKENWLKDMYYNASNNALYQEAENILIKLETISSFWKVEHAALALRMREYHKASEIYLSLFKEAEDAKVKRKWLIKALESLQYGNLMDDAVHLAKRYEQTYLDDDMMTEMFLKLYLRANDLEAASDLSKKLLNKGR